jgi:hypothetical protein
MDFILFVEQHRQYFHLLVFANLGHRLSDNATTCCHPHTKTKNTIALCNSDKDSVNFKPEPNEDPVNPLPTRIVHRNLWPDRTRGVNLAQNCSCEGDQ